MLIFDIVELDAKDPRARIGQKVKVNYFNHPYEGIVKNSRICNGKLEHFIKLNKPAIIDNDSFSFLLVYEEEIIGGD